VLLKNIPLSFTSYEISPLLKISFFVDRLAAFFILVISIISFCVALYSFDYVNHYENPKKRNLLVFFMSSFIISMILVVCSKTTFAFLFFWEIMSLSSFFLVMFNFEKEETKKAGLFYFIMTQLSTVFLFIAFLILAIQKKNFLIDATLFSSPILLAIFLSCLLVGFCIKAGVVPFHKWLPYAHPASPSNISALMSGVMIKVAIYGIIRFFMLYNSSLFFGILILCIGTISAILGVIYALKEHDIKRLLAYHSIENIGIILIGFGLYIIFETNNLYALATLSLIAALFHTLNHALFKSLLFLTAGSVIMETKTKNIEEMGGLIKQMPYTGFFFLIGAISICALPPFNGFVSEFMIFESFLKSSALVSPMLKLLLIICVSIFALMSALAAACFVKAFSITFLAAPRSEHARHAKEVPFLMLLSNAILAGLCFVLGVYSYPIFSLFGLNLPVPNLMIVGIITGIIFIAAYIFFLVFASKKERVPETWGCGINTQTPAMEYTASGFSEPIVTIFRGIYRTKKEVHKEYYDNKNCIVKEGNAEISLFNFFELYIYMPVVNFFSKVSDLFCKMQNGNLDAYILYALFGIVFLFIYIGWFT